MKNVKRYLAFALAAFTVTALFAGCGKKETPEPTEKENPTGITEVEKTEAPTEEQTERIPDYGDVSLLEWKEINGEIQITGVGKYSGTDLVIPAEIDGKPVTSIGEQAFAHCNDDEDENSTGVKLITVTLPDTVKVLNPSAFFNCGNLEEINFGNGLETIGEGVLHYCRALKELYIPASLKELGWLRSTNLNYIEVDENNENYSSEDGILFNKDKTTLIYYPRNKEDAHYIVPESVKTIEGDAFASNEYLNEVTLGSNVESLGTFFGGFFSGCDSLSVINVAEENKNYSSVDGVLFNKDKTTMYYYAPAKSGKEYVVPAGVTELWNYKCFNNAELEIITIPETVENIDVETFGYIGNITLKGKTGSYAEQYANEHNIKFVAI